MRHDVNIYIICAKKDEILFDDDGGDGDGGDGDGGDG